MRKVCTKNKLKVEIMDINSKENIPSPKIVAKAGLWYTICTFTFKAMAFLTTPFFTRYMSKSELGGFTDFSSLASILIVITSMDLYQSIIRSKSEFYDDMDSYIWSLMSLSTIWTLFVYLIFIIFPKFFQTVLKINYEYIHVLFFYLLFSPSYTMLITKQRAFYKYKHFVLLTGIMAFSGTTLSFILVLLMNNKLAGRIIGFYFPFIFFGSLIFIYIAIKGKKIKLTYWKYASKICIPLVPHDLSLHILGVSDVILITRLCGQEYTAYYSVAYSAYHIATVFFDAMNKAWAPWLLDSLDSKNYDSIKKVSKIYISTFCFIIIGIILLVPEIILILGGKQYNESIYCLPPLLASSAFLFIFTMYVNIEFFEKKTHGVSIATAIGCIINIVLNIIFIPLFKEKSYIVAAYTTLVGYVFLFTVHFFIVRSMKMDFVYDTHFIFKTLLFIFIISVLMNIIYKILIIRLIIIIIYILIFVLIIVKYHRPLREILLEKKLN